MGWVWKQDRAWRGAYRDEAGKQHTKSFPRQIDAEERRSLQGGSLRGVTGRRLARARAGGDAAGCAPPPEKQINGSTEVPPATHSGMTGAAGAPTRFLLRV